MAANRRIFFATKAVGIAPFSSTTFLPVHGCQSVGISTNFSLQNIQELGQLNVYQLIEQIPEIEVSVEKVLDGSPLLYHLSTQGAPDGSLIGRSNQRCEIALSVYGDTQGAASGTPQSEVHCSGMYPQQISYSFSTDQPFKESCTFVGNEKIYKASAFNFAPTGFLNNDVPLALAGSGGVQMRWNFIFYPVLAAGDPNSSKETAGTLDGNGQVNAFLTILPPEVGVSSSGTNDRDSTGNFLAHVQSINCNCNLGRDAILELGRKMPYFRFVQWPVQTTTEISVIALETDSINATEKGLDGAGNNLVTRTIKVRTLEGTWIDMGTQNKLQTISFQGGNTDGGQVTTTFSYLNYNVMGVSHPRDPAGFAWPY